MTTANKKTSLSAATAKVTESRFVATVAKPKFVIRAQPVASTRMFD